MELAIEVMELGNHRSYVSRFTGNEIKIGRGWNNDLVVRDPLVDPDHLRIYLGEEGQVWLQDLESRNGTRVGGKRMSTDIQVEFGVPLRIGHSTIVIHRADEAVAQAEPRPQFEPLIERMQQPVIASIALVLALLSAYGSGLFAPDLSITGDDRWSRAFAFALGLIVWAAVWGVFSRLLRHEVAFWGHLTLASVTCTAVLLSYVGVSWLSFNTLSLILKAYGFETIFTLALLGWCLLGLDMTTRLKPIKRSLISVGVTGAALILLFVSPIGGGREDDPRRPPMVNITQPPQRLVVGDISVEDFLGRTDRLFASLDEELANEE